MKVLLACCSVCLALALTVSSAIAQEIIVPQFDQFDEYPSANPAEMTTPDVFLDAATGDFVLGGTVAYPTGSRTTLTLRQPFCGNNFIVRYEAKIAGQMGSTTSNFLYDVEGKHRAFLGDLDVFKDGVPYQYRSFEPDANHIDICTAAGTAYTVGGGLRVEKYLSVPFSMSNNQWFKVELAYDHGNISHTVTGPNGATARLASAIPHTDDTPIYFSLEASFGSGAANVAVNQKRVRNIQIVVLEECKSQLDEAGIVQSVDPLNLLNGCPIEDQYLNECLSRLEDLRDTGVINSKDYQTAHSLIQSKAIYCNGVNECRADLESVKKENYDRGFGEGAASIDQEAIRKAGFDAGVASIDQAAIRQAGFDAGVASVDRAKIAQDAYNEGFWAGKESVPACVTPAPSPTPAPTPEEYSPGGDHRLYEAVLLECPCNAAKSLEEHVTCVSIVTDALYDSGRISDHLRNLVRLLAIESQCGNTQTDDDEVGCKVKPHDIVLTLCPCDLAKNHGAYVSCVTHQANELKKLGIITNEEKASLVSEAAHSSCGKPANSQKKSLRGAVSRRRHRK